MISDTYGHSETQSLGQKRRGRVWRYGPIACWLALSFWLSTDAFSGAHTVRIVRPLLMWLFPGISDGNLDWGHTLIRKSAHFTEYALGTVLIARALMTSSQPWLRRGWFAWTLLLFTLLALTDEYHQTFVASRKASIKDVLIDMGGGCVVLTALVIWRRWYPTFGAAVE